MSEPNSRVLPPLVVVGPTASGKTGLSLALAERNRGTEILSADAMAIYRDMSIGTAKPTAAERQRVVHHGVDLFAPDEEATVAAYQYHAQTVLADLQRRAVNVIIVGGTGLYVRAVVDNFTVPPQYPELRQKFEADPDTEGMWRRLAELDPPASQKMLPTNRRRIVRALEVTVGSGQPFSSFGPGVDHYPPTTFRLAGLEVDRTVLDARIDARYNRQMADGMLAEVAAVYGAGMSKTAAQALGYKELIAHLNGDLSLDEALDEAKRRTRKFARRQQRWFRRDPRITWFDAMADDLVAQVEDWWMSAGSSESEIGGDASIRN